VVYLALAPKSNALYTAYSTVLEDVEKTAAEPVPLHIRNAVTNLMKQVGLWQGLPVTRTDLEEKSRGHGVHAGQSARGASITIQRRKAEKKLLAQRMQEIKQRKEELRNAEIKKTKKPVKRRGKEAEEST